MIQIHSTRHSSQTVVIIIIIIKNEKIRVTRCENAAGALYIVNKNGGGLVVELAA